MSAEYSIISAPSVEELERKVNRAIEDFQATPIGGPFVARAKGGGPLLGEHYYYQAMLRPARE